jgi:hypothetical protein
MICPRCGNFHQIQRFTVNAEPVAFAQSGPGPRHYRPFITGFICDGWIYQVKAEPVAYEQAQVPTA